MALEVVWAVWSVPLCLPKLDAGGCLLGEGLLVEALVKTWSQLTEAVSLHLEVAAVACRVVVLQPSLAGSTRPAAPVSMHPMSAGSDRNRDWTARETQFLLVGGPPALV